METTIFLRKLGPIALSCFCSLLAPGTAAAQELFPHQPSIYEPRLDSPRADWGTDYTNWVELSFGNFWVDGSRAEFQRRHYLPEGPFGGIEGFHTEQALSDKDIVDVDGRAIFGNEDYDVRLGYTRTGVGYVRGGYREYRAYYDRHGGYIPDFNAWSAPFSRDVHLDRGEIWFETGLRLENAPEITFRYTHQFRDGIKDSTIWGDYNVNIGTTLPADRRNIVPAYRQIDEE